MPKVNVVFPNNLPKTGNSIIIVRGFSPLIETLNPPFQKVITTVHPIALQRPLMASLVIRFFSSLIPSKQRTNFCNFVTKVYKIAKAVGSSNFLDKALRALS